MAAMFRSSPSHSLGLWLYALLAIPMWFFLAWAAALWQPFLDSPLSDYWEHAAAIETWRANLLNPPSPHVGADVGSPRYMPFYFFVVSLARLFSLSTHQALAIGAIVSTTVFLIFVPAFARRYFKTNWSAAILLIVLVCGWGVAWYWSNVYQLSVLPFVVTYPSFFVFALSFALYWLASGPLDTGRQILVTAIAMVGLTALAFSSHPLTAAYTTLTVTLLVLFRQDPSVIPKAALLAAIALGLLAAEIWPFYSPWGVVLGQATPDGATWISQIATSEPSLSGLLGRAEALRRDHPFYDAEQVLVALGPAALGIVFLIRGKPDRQRLMLGVGFAVCLAVYIANLFVHVPLGHRALLFATFYLHLGVVWLTLRLLVGSSENPTSRHSNLLRGAAILFLVGLIAQTLWLIQQNINDRRIYPTFPPLAAPTKSLFGEDRLADAYRSVAEQLSDDSVVMTTPLTGWPLPSFRGKVVVPLHPNPLLGDLNERRSVVKKFFSSSDNQWRQQQLETYGITHVLWRRSELDAAVAAELQNLDLTPVKCGEHFMLFSVNSR